MKIKLKEILDEKNISVYSLAKSTNISPNNLSKLIKGETISIRFENLESICKTLNITPNDMFEF